MLVPLLLIAKLLLSCSQVDKPLLGTFQHNNLERKYIYYQPAELQQNSPLLVVLHGFTSNANKIMEYSNFNELAQSNGFAVLYPQGTIDNDSNTFWNVGYSFHQNIRTDDVNFIILLTEFIKEKYHLSSSNTFLTGMSNGGEMCFKIACERPESFKAIASVAGMMLDTFYENAQNIPIPVFATFGTADDVTRYEGDSANIDGWGAYQTIEKSIRYWANNNYFINKTVDSLPNVSLADGSYIIKTHYHTKQCVNDVMYYKVINGGHDWPGAWGNMDVQISEEIWNFFYQIMNSTK